MNIIEAVKYHQAVKSIEDSLIDFNLKIGFKYPEEKGVVYSTINENHDEILVFETLEELNCFVKGLEYMCSM